MGKLFYYLFLTENIEQNLNLLIKNNNMDKLF